MEKKKPLLAVRPRFDTNLAFAESSSVTLIVTVGVTALGGTFFYILFSMLGRVVN